MSKRPGMQGLAGLAMIAAVAVPLVAKAAQPAVNRARKGLSKLADRLSDYADDLERRHASTAATAEPPVQDAPKAADLEIEEPAEVPKPEPNPIVVPDLIDYERETVIEPERDEQADDEIPEIPATPPEYVKPEIPVEVKKKSAKTKLKAVKPKAKKAPKKAAKPKKPAKRQRLVIDDIDTA